MKTSTAKLSIIIAITGLSLSAQGQDQVIPGKHNFTGPTKKIADWAQGVANKSVDGVNDAMRDNPNKSDSDLQGVPYKDRVQNDLNASLKTKQNLDKLLDLSQQLRDRTWQNYMANRDDPDAKADAQAAMNDYKNLVDWRNRASQRLTNDSLALQDQGVDTPFIPPDKINGAPLPDTRDIVQSNTRDAAVDAARNVGTDTGREIG